MSLEVSILLFTAGLVAGSVSAIAGGSGLITFPVLLSLGLPPTVANATNFVSVLMGNASALPAYLKELRQYQSSAFKLIGAGLCGGALGSSLMLITPDEQFLSLVPWLLLTATILFALGSKGQTILTNHLGRLPSYLGWAVVFFVSIYGGYFGAGLGVILLATLILLGFQDFHEANALKNLTNTAIGLLGVGIYTFAGLISWPHALIMMTGSLMGGYLGIRLARHVPAVWLTNSIICLGIVLTGYYFLS